WLYAAARAEARSGRPGGRSRGALIGLSTLPGVALTLLYFRGFRKGLHPPSTGGILDYARTGLQFLTGGVGMPATWAWPWSGALTLALVVLALVFLARAWVREADERPRVVGLAAFLAALTALAAAVGWGRGWAGDQAGF